MKRWVCSEVKNEYDIYKQSPGFVTYPSGKLEIGEIDIPPLYQLRFNPQYYTFA